MLHKSLALATALSALEVRIVGSGDQSPRQTLIFPLHFALPSGHVTDADRNEWAGENAILKLLPKPQNVELGTFVGTKWHFLFWTSDELPS